MVQSKRYTIHWEDRGLYARFTGAISARDLSDAQEMFQGNERFDDCEYAIWDFLDCDPSAIERDELDMILANHLGATYTLKYHRGAFVCREPKLLAIMDQMVGEAKKLGSQWDFGTFDSKEAAYAWAKVSLA